MMIIVGSLVLLLGLCMGLVMAMLTGPMSAQISQNMPPGLTQQQIGWMLKLVAGFLLVIALVEIVMGILVRSGKMAPIVISLVLTVLGVLYFILNLVVILRGGNPATKAPSHWCPS